MGLIENLSIHSAVMDGDIFNLKVLLARGESPDVPGTDGFTPLHLAAQQYSLSAAAALLDAGACVDSENRFGNTPLFVAVFNSNGRGKLIRLLRAHGADPRHVNSTGQTPIGLARLIANFDVVQYFADLAD